MICSSTGYQSPMERPERSFRSLIASHITTSPAATTAIKINTNAMRQAVGSSLTLRSLHVLAASPLSRRGGGKRQFRLVAHRWSLGPARPRSRGHDDDSWKEPNAGSVR